MILMGVVYLAAIPGVKLLMNVSGLGKHIVRV
jgi:hypothetical protein